MRRQSVMLLWALASLLGLPWGLYLTFFPIGMMGTTTVTATGEMIETTRATYEPLLGLTVMTVLLMIYGLLGLALSARHYAAFAMIAAVHIVLSLLATMSIDRPLQPSSALLCLAILASIALKDHPTHRDSPL